MTASVSDLLAGFDWATPFIADACVALGLPPRTAGSGLRPIAEGQRVAGPARPAKHAGSVDVFLEAIHDAAPGDVLVIENVGRLDEGCIGDMIAAEALAAGMAGIVVWGAHRDGPAIRRIGIPVWSLGTCPVGPVELRQRSPHALQAASIGSHTTVTRDDVIFLDDDGAMVVESKEVVRVVDMARQLAEREAGQAARLAAGERLWQQFDVEGYLAARKASPDLTFRDHIRARRGAIET
ncbi:MAG: RraA family protein [Vicinamibacterales bacterium]